MKHGGANCQPFIILALFWVSPQGYDDRFLERGALLCESRVIRPLLLVWR